MGCLSRGIIKQFYTLNKPTEKFKRFPPKSHTSLVTRKKLLIGFRHLLSYLPCSPDLMLSDYQLFCSMQNSFNGKVFNGADDVCIHIWFINHNSKILRFYQGRMMTYQQKRTELNLGGNFSLDGTLILKADWNLLALG